MKPLLFALLLAGTAITPASSATLQSLKIDATELPTIPITRVARGITEAVVRVAISVSAEGRLDDWLLVAYSDELLAQEAVRALQKWRFVPAQLDGEPVAVQTVITFNIRVDGVVVSQNAVDHFLSYARRGLGPEMIYRPRTMKEIDRIPTPLEVVSPAYTPEMAQAGLGGEISVDFYIDEQGRVRLPVVGSDQHSQLAANAMEAVRHWKFEPPTSHGRPVLVHARQRFTFSPPAATPESR